MRRHLGLHRKMDRMGRVNELPYLWWLCCAIFEVALILVSFGGSPDRPRLPNVAHLVLYAYGPRNCWVLVVPGFLLPEWFREGRDAR